MTITRVIQLTSAMGLFTGISMNGPHITSGELMSMIFCRSLLSLLLLILVVGSVSFSSISAIAASATGKTANPW